MNRSILFAGAALACAAFMPSGAQAQAAAPARVFSASLPASGRHDTIVTLARWGRYSLQSSGPVPAALSISDRRTGVLQRDGEPGQRHGRIDLFLDLGEYKLSVQGPKRASGNVNVSAVPFAPAPGAASARLIPLRENRFVLDDMQQAAFWFELPADTSVWLEAAGRGLSEMALWRDGEWRVPAAFGAFTARPAEGTPWSGFAGPVRLAKGTYMAGLYGGPPRAWSEKAGEHPGYLRMGLETMGAGIRAMRELPPHGMARLLLTPGVADVVVEETGKRRLAAEITRLGADFSPAGWMAGDSIHGKSAAPRMLLHPGDVPAGQGWRLLTLSGASGQAYTVQTFGAGAWTFAGKEDRVWWVSSQHSGNPVDQIGASGAIVDLRDGSLAAVAADTVGAKEVARKFNLLDRMTAFVWIPEGGKYAFAPGGTRYQWSLSRYFLHPPRDYAAPAMAEGAKTLDLNAGLHVLTLVPAEKGVATFVLGKASLLGGLLAAGKSALGIDAQRVWDAPRPEMRFSRVTLGKDDSYGVILNSQAPELSTVSIRKLPLDLDEAPVALWLKPGERAQVSVRLAGKRILTARDAAGKPVPFDAGGKRAPGKLEGEGNVIVTLEGAGEARQVFLSALPPERSSDGPAPGFPDAARAALPAFPALRPDQPVFLDLERGGLRTYALRVDRPGLYRLETAGLLRTGLRLSDRFRNFTREAEANGVARNALILEYLLPGEYQLEVSARGESAGHLGLSAARNAWVEAGALEAGLDNRAFVPAFSGAAYGVRIAAAGRYRFESQGLNGNHQLRLEDAEGWPADPATAASPRTETLDPGEYRLFSLPAPREGRRVARLVPLIDKRAIKGKGPHPLALNTTLSSTWMDEAPKAGKDSIGAPAVFTFSLPAPIAARLSVSSGFKAALYRDGQDTAAAEWTGRRKAALPMGEYRLLIVPEKKRNLAPYQVSVSTRELIAGLAYDLRSRETFAVDLGRPGIVEFASQGMLDVAATLLAEDGKTVLGTNDDGYLDWNFSISRDLPAGRYFLRVVSAEPGFTRTTVFMRALADTLLDTLAAGAGKDIRLERRLGILPLAPGRGDVIACAAAGKSRLGLALERARDPVPPGAGERPAGAGPVKSGAGAPGQAPAAATAQRSDRASGEAGQGNAWVTVARDEGESPSVSVPRAPGARYRLKVWSETRSDDPVTVSYAAPIAQPADAREAASGLTGKPSPLGGWHRAWFKVDLGPNAPGRFRTVSDRNPLAGLAVSATLDSAFDGEDGTEFSSLARYAWLELRFEQAGRFRVKAEPAVLADGQGISLPLAGGRPQVIAARRAAVSAGLLRAEADGAHPLAGPLASGTGPRFGVRGVSVAQGFALNAAGVVTVALPGDSGRMAVWNAAPGSEGGRPAAKLSWTELPLGDGGSAAPGVSEWKPGAPAARVLHLPAASGLRLRVILPPQGVAVLRRPDGAREVVCDFDEEPLAREFQARGGDLFLLAPAKGSRFETAVFAAEQRAEAPSALGLGAGRAFDFAAGGRELLPLAADKPLRCFYRGAALKSLGYFGADGRLRDDLPDGSPVGPGGILALNHGDGMARLDLCASSGPAAVMACKWAATLTPSGAREIVQSSVSGLHDQVNWFTFALRDTQHVNLAAPVPLAAILLSDGNPIRYQEAWERFNWDLPLPPGRYALGIRPFAGAALEGSSLSGLFRPLPTVAETRPFTAYLGPGESRLLRFDVARKGEYGIGLRMDRETAEARLYDAAGRVVAQGKQQFVKLAPGTYHLWLRVPEGSAGTAATVLVFGQEAPPNEPPERLVKWIVEGAEGPRPETAQEQDAAPEEQRPSWERFLRGGSYVPESGEDPSQAGESGEAAGEGENAGDGDGGYRGEDGDNGGDEGMEAGGESGDEGSAPADDGSNGEGEGE